MEKSHAMWFFALLVIMLDVQLISGYKGAVFEHAQVRHVKSNHPDDIIQANLEYYKMAVKVAGSKGAEVIVFPEYGIFPPISIRPELKQFLEYVPDPKVARSNPCEEPHLYSKRPILYTMSCLARVHGMIIVVNMGDIQPCAGQKDCPKDGSFHYNTNVVFNRNGAILAKYHKEHLFGEAGMDVPPLGKQDPTFETDLGRFATFVCFDIIFQRIVEVAHWKGVDTILFPTMWIDAAPLYNGIQHFQAWAIGNNVTLLAANVQLPGEGGIGSGIVKGREGALVYTFNPDGHSKLLIADVKNPDVDSSMYIITTNGSTEFKDDGKDVGSVCSSKVLGPTKDIYKDYRCGERDMSHFTFIKLKSNSDSIHACNNGVCCTLHYTASHMQENYFLGIDNGTYNALNRYFFPEEVCFLARCDGMGNKSCVTFPTRSKTLFHQVHLKSNFSTNFIYPTVMTSGMRLAPKSQWKFESRNQAAYISFDSDTGKELLMVGLKGRPYDRDPPYHR